MNTLANADTAVLMSIFKPIVVTIVLGFWATAVGRIDKDLLQHFFPRRQWNMILMLSGVLGFALWLFVGSFWIGLPIALLVLGGSLVAYVQFHNKRVREEHQWSFNPKTWAGEKFAAKRFADAQQRAVIAFTTKAGVRQDVPTGDKNPQAIAHQKAEEILGFALPRGAQRIDLTVGAQKATAVVIVDGVAYPAPEMDNKTGVLMLDYLKGIAKLDVEDRRKKQVGELYLESGAEKKSHLIRVITIGSTREISATLLVDPNKQVAMRLQDLGLLPAQLKSLEPVLKETGKAVLVTCPPGNGMTTTLYACINQHDPYTQSVVTLEDEVAYEVEGVTHTVIKPGSDAQAISQALLVLTRRDPSVIMVSKVSDVPTAKVVAGSAGEIRIYAGMKGEDTFGSLKTWIKSIGNPKDAAATLAAIISPRLVRKLCTTCRIPFKPDPAALQKMNLPPDKVQQLYKPGGKVMVKKEEQVCNDCQGMGYKGRTGVFEVMVLDDDARKLIAQGQLDQLRAHLRKQRMLWLQEAALTRVVEGVTSIAEIGRALSKEGGEAKAAAPQPAGA